MIDEKKLLEILSKNSIFAKITNAEGKNIFEIIDSLPKFENCANCSRRKFYLNGYLDGLNANDWDSKWISCKERLPADKEIVLFQTKSKRMYVGYYDSQFKSFECVTARNSHVKGLKPVVWRILPVAFEGE